MPRTSKNKFEIINDEIHISKEGWPLIGLTTYREDYYEELTLKTWTLKEKPAFLIEKMQVLCYTIFSRKYY